MFNGWHEEKIKLEALIEERLKKSGPVSRTEIWELCKGKTRYGYNIIHTTFTKIINRHIEEGKAVVLKPGKYEIVFTAIHAEEVKDRIRTQQQIRDIKAFMKRNKKYLDEILFEVFIDLQVSGKASIKIDKSKLIP